MPSSMPVPKPQLAALTSLFEGPKAFPMRMRRATLEIPRPSGVERVDVPFLSGPGHNCSLVAGLGVDKAGKLVAVLRTGDTRAARSLRGEDYVRKGFIGGRHDKMKDAAHIALEEVAEETGGRTLKGGFRALGDRLLPTMPNESTEADQYFVAVMSLDGQVTGDGGGMELPGLIKPLPVPIDLGEAFGMMEKGEISDGARCRLVYQRGLDSIGYIPQLGVWVHDHPQLLARWDTLGLGEVWDPRQLEPNPPPPPSSGEEVVVNPDAARVNSVKFHSCEEIPVEPGVKFLNAVTSHAIDGEKPVGKPFPNYILKVDYDRAKVAVHTDDAHPLVKLVDVERPVMAAKGLLPPSERSYRNENTDLVRPDLVEMKVTPGGARAEVEKALGVPVTPLCSHQGASEGQTDLRYHYFAAEGKADASFVPLREALRACRQGNAGDAPMEGALDFLAWKKDYIPCLDMTVEEARRLLG